MSGGEFDKRYRVSHPADYGFFCTCEPRHMLQVLLYEYMCMVTIADVFSKVVSAT